MHVFLVFTCCGIASYLLGAIPFGYLIAISRGVDLHKTGSGSIGATNVLRSVGKKWGYLTFFLDALKGFVPAFFFPLAVRTFIEGDMLLVLSLVCSAMAVAGHNWPVYLRFKGGKGVATSAGALLGIVPLLTITGLVTWAALFLLTRFVSVASILTALILITVSWPLYIKMGLLRPVTITVLGIILVWQHRSNIRRLRDGMEHRFDFRKRNLKPGGNR